MQDIFKKRCGKTPRWSKGKAKSDGDGEGSLSSSASESTLSGLADGSQPGLPLEQTSELPEQESFEPLPSLPSLPSFLVDPVRHMPLAEVPGAELAGSKVAVREGPGGQDVCLSPKSVATTVEDLPDEDVYLPAFSFVKWPSLDAAPPSAVNFAHLLPPQEGKDHGLPTSPLISPESLPNSPKGNGEEDSQVLKDLDNFLLECSQAADAFSETVPPAASEEIAYADTFVQEDLQGLTDTQAIFV